MLNLCLTLLFLFVCLTVFLWVASFFFQGYIYTQPSDQLYWQAPAAALLLTVGLAAWCFTVALSAKSTKQIIPYDTLLNFSVKENLADRPPEMIWAIKADPQKAGEANRDGERIAYTSRRLNNTQYQYKDKNTSLPWQPMGVIAIEFENPDGTKMRLDAVSAEQGKYRTFESPDGWVWPELENGPVDAPMKFILGRLILNLVFNFGHLLFWFLALWIVLRFQWSHALGFAFVMWLIFTFIVVPILLSRSRDVAVSSRIPTSAMTRWIPVG